MTTAFQTGPGFYAADTSKVDGTIPSGIMRVYCARLEAYDITGSPADPGNDITFVVLPALAENNPQIAKALLKLGESITANKAVLESFL